MSEASQQRAQIEAMLYRHVGDEWPQTALVSEIENFIAEVLAESATVSKGMLAADFAHRAMVYEAHPEHDTDRYLDGFSTGMRVAEKIVRDGPAPQEPVLVERAARALYDHDFQGTDEANREALWLLHRGTYTAKAQALADAGLLTGVTPPQRLDSGSRGTLREW